MKNSPSEYVSSRSSFQAGVVPVDTPDSAIKTLTPAKTEAEHEIKLEGAFNVRDLGGFITKDGRQIKAHRLLRSARLNHLMALTLISGDRRKLLPSRMFACPVSHTLMIPLIPMRVSTT